MVPLGFQSRSLYDEFEEPIHVRRSAKVRGFLGRTISTLKERARQLLFWMSPRLRKRFERERRRKTILMIIAGLFGAGVLLLIILWLTLPNIDDPETMFPAQSTVIVDRNGVELYRLFSGQDRTYVSGDAISDSVKKATIAIEDQRFFDRSICFDVVGFTRAALSQVLPGIFVRSGGSTLTQQFAGNALVGRNRSLIRKIREYMLACALEQKYNKDQLLELYLNWIPYGQNAYGIEQASRNYFAKPAKDLTLAESAVLASLPQRPSYLSPYGYHVHTEVSEKAVEDIASGKIKTASSIADKEVTLGLLGNMVGTGSTKIYIGGRTDQVLENMVQQKMITEEERAAAVQDLAKVKFAPERQNIRAAHFVLEVQRKVQELLGIDESVLERGGFRITTTLDWNIQQAAEKSVTKHKDDFAKRFGAHNIALVSLDPRTRETLAYVGNADFNDDENQGKIDMAKVPRQPGSSFKAFVYLAAFDAGAGPGSAVYDVPTKFGEDEPQNFDGAFWGLMSMRSALAASRNIPAIKAFFLAGGEDTVLSLASRVGVTAPLEQKQKQKSERSDFAYGWPLAIGAAEVPLTQMVDGYSTIAAGGVRKESSTILKITDKDGNIRYESKPQPATQVVDERVAAQVTSVLSDVSARPNEYWQQILSVPGTQAAAKTGTSNKCLERDQKNGCTLRRPESVWTIGYTPSLVTGVWVGNATSQSLFEKADGLTTAAPIWHDMMASAQKYVANAQTTFPVPSRMVTPQISKLSGKLASQCTPIEMRTSDIFLEERVPTEEDTSCEQLEVDRVTGLLSSPACPPDAVEQGSFFKPVSESPTRWPLWESAVQEWAKKQDEAWKATETHSGSQLPLPLAPTETCDPSLTPGRNQKPSLTILSPGSGGGVPYPAFAPKLQIQSSSAVREVKYEIDGKVVATVSEAPFTSAIRVPRTISEEGTHTLTVTITDQYFNTAEDSVQFRFESDSGGPSISIVKPTNGSQLAQGTTIKIQANVTDSGGVDRVQFFIDDQLITTKRAEPYDADYSVSADPGSHTIKVTARDGAGNESNEEVNVTVQ